MANIGWIAGRNRIKHQAVRKVAVAGSDGGVAPIRAVLNAQGDALALFSKSEANLLVRVALDAGGRYFLDTFIPLRFTDYVKRSPFNYHVTRAYAWWKNKKGFGATPLVLTGALRDTVLSKSHYEARVTANKARIRIYLPAPSATNADGKKANAYANMQPMVRAVLRTISAWEIERIAGVVGKVLEGETSIGRSDVTVSTGRGGKTVARLDSARKSDLRSRTTYNKSTRAMHTIMPRATAGQRVA